MTTKEKILASALKLFAKQGIDKTSTAQITKDVGIASGTLFVHFKTKQDLVNSLYKGIKEKLLSGINAFVKEDDCESSNIKISIKHMMEYFLKNYESLKFIELTELGAHVSKDVREEIEKKYSFVYNGFENLKNQGELKDIELEILQDIVWQNMQTIVRQHKNKKLKSIDDIYVDVVWDSIKK
ncbi:MAG: TetR/AcrR family transcriptional regulator [Alphaproteobacteria bacterium]|jgi:AcrR family transcriptional regulator|nr:TetR/AcrR family transcriptional regulator [Alphaproteobacteria bacterium]